MVIPTQNRTPTTTHLAATPAPTATFDLTNNGAARYGNTLGSATVRSPDRMDAAYCPAGRYYLRSREQDKYDGRRNSAHKLFGRSVAYLRWSGALSPAQRAQPSTPVPPTPVLPTPVPTPRPPTPETADTRGHRHRDRRHPRPPTLEATDAETADTEAAGRRGHRRRDRRRRDRRRRDRRRRDRRRRDRRRPCRRRPRAADARAADARAASTPVPPTPVPCRAASVARLARPTIPVPVGGPNDPTVIPLPAPSI